MVSHQFCGLDALSPTQLQLFVDTFRQFYLPLAIAYSISILSLILIIVMWEGSINSAVAIPDGAPYGMPFNFMHIAPQRITEFIIPLDIAHLSVFSGDLVEARPHPNILPIQGSCSPERSPSPRTSFYHPHSASKGVVLLQTLSLSKGGVLLSSHPCDRVWFPLTAPVPEHPAQSSMPW